jgi:hypothetical protein
VPPHHVAFNIAHEGLTQEPPLLVGGSAGTFLLGGRGSSAERVRHIQASRSLAALTNGCCRASPFHGAAFGCIPA